MDKSTFEKIINQKSEDIYQQNKRKFSNMLTVFFNENSNMNVHESGNSVLYTIDMFTNSLFEQRKKEIINKISKQELDSLFSKLNDISFLFENRNE